MAAATQSAFQCHYLASHSKRIKILWGLILLLVLFVSNSVASKAIVKTLPGFTGELPFVLETGYISVNDSELFYYFIESQGNPQEDPLFLWLTGGPGCSSFSGIVYEIGIIIFLDSPVGTGFSYSKTVQGWPSSDTASSEQAYQFLRKWLEENPQYLFNPLFIAGDSYSGIIVPLITKLIVEVNVIRKCFQGYLIGSPTTDEFINSNSKIPFAHRLALISDDLYEAFNYVLSYTWANDPGVQEALHVREGLFLKLTYFDVSLHSGDHDMVVPFVATDTWIRALNLPVVEKWRPWFVDDQVVGYVDVGGDPIWHFISTIIFQLENDFEAVNRFLICSFPLFLIGNDRYTRKYSENGFCLTYVTVKGAGHTAPEYYRRQCYEMFQRWLHAEPL
ncbi:Serine carboxypeptidase 7 [Spatholobus suberectus]|nr:Serine carboxypeptidase 7 [Spatholobus suberectus]